MKEKTYFIALVFDLSSINMEKKIISLRICISSFVPKELKKTTKKKTHYSGKPYTYGNVRLTKVPNEATLQAVRRFKPSV